MQELRPLRLPVSVSWTAHGGRLGYASKGTTTGWPREGVAGALALDSPWSMECCGSWLSWLLTTPA